MASSKSDGKMIFMIFVGAIITVVFLGVIADQVFTQTNQIAVVNHSVTVPSAANTTFSPQLPGRANTTAIVVLNDSGTFTVNFSVNTTDASGNLGTFLFLKDDGISLNGSTVNLTWTYEPFGYIQESSGRNVSALIPIFSALAILVFVIVIIWKFGAIKDMIARKSR